MWLKSDITLSISGFQDGFQYTSNHTNWGPWSYRPEQNVFGCTRRTCAVRPVLNATWGLCFSQCSSLLFGNFLQSPEEFLPAACGPLVPPQEKHRYHKSVPPSRFGQLSLKSLPLVNSWAVLSFPFDCNGIWSLSCRAHVFSLPISHEVVDLVSKMWQKVAKPGINLLYLPNKQESYFWIQSDLY